KTVEDLKAALDAVVIKRGVFNLVFHPHGWIKPEQVVELIDHAKARHGGKVKFLTFREAKDRLDRNLLTASPSGSRARTVPWTATGTVSRRRSCAGGGPSEMASRGRPSSRMAPTTASG